MAMIRVRVRRFSRVEVAYHWIQAILYLVLVFTGGTLLLQRLLDREYMSPDILGLVHRVTGITLIFVLLQMLVLILFAEPFRVLKRTFHESLSWSKGDLLWIAKVVASTAMGRIRLPAVGRFNPGQKFHIVLIVFLVFGFTISGLSMMLVPGALAFWIVHVTLFLPACIYLTVHLFLSLINPSTRRGLGGIFNGHVSEEYAAAHHPLWVGRELHEHGHRLISLKAIAMTLLVASPVAVYATLHYGFENMETRARKLAAHWGADVIQPRALSAGHANDPEASRCFSCHRYLSSPPSVDCLECHERIRNVMVAEIGFHGTLEGECRTCHAEHAGPSTDIRNLDADGFNHRLARFRLEGRHGELECGKCHRRMDPDTGLEHVRFIGLAYSLCTDCHDNVHADERAADCLRCHTLNGWKRELLVFDHDHDSRYPLLGEHVKVECRKCHEPDPGAPEPSPLMLFGRGLTCAECHKDPHGGQFENACQHCHTENGWKGRWVVDAHGPGSEYPLVGAHAGVECRKCHTPPTEESPLAEARFVDLATSCLTCHTDPHEGQFEKTCEACHSEQGWKGRWLVDPHGPKANYVLEGKHVALGCTKCHTLPTENARLAEARFAQLPIACEGCHKDPHQGQMSSPCLTCHDEAGWAGQNLRFAHEANSEFALDPVHRGLECSSCHGAGESVVYTPLPTSCQGCHREIDLLIRGESLTISGPPDPHAGRVRCTQCHTMESRLPSDADYASACRSCHNQQYAGLFYDWENTFDEFQMKADRADAPVSLPPLSQNGIEEARIAEARKIGFHNIQLALRLWQEIVGEESPAPRHLSP